MVGASVAAFLEPSRPGRHMGGEAWSLGCHASGLAHDRPLQRLAVLKVTCHLVAN